MKYATQRVLLVDDDLDDQFFTARALRKVLPAGSAVHLVHSGEEAMQYLSGEAKYSDREKYPFPSIIVCDLNMPNGDGFDVLEFLQGNTAWSVIPRVVFSASDDDDDVRTAFLLGASAYHLKPTQAERREASMRRMIEYWSTSEVPPIDKDGRLRMTRSKGRLGARYPQPAGGAQMQRARRIAKPEDGPAQPEAGTG